MATLKTNLIEPEGATTTLTVGEAGGDLVIGADSLKANKIKARETITTYTTAATTSFSVPTGVTSVEYLVVGGGGGGGASHAGDAAGGGAGDFKTGTLSVTPGASLTVTVGAAGIGPTDDDDKGGNGGSSVFSSITSTGGGGGGSRDNDDGADGASGGGGSAYGGVGGDATTVGVTGYPGGDHVTGGSHDLAGGGGGFTGPGLDGNISTAIAGDGGPGTSSSITGLLVEYAGGGGGGAYSSGTAYGGRGKFGGGDGGVVPMAGNTQIGFDARANSGSGGGGSASYTPSTAAGGDGGSGIVVLKYDQPTGGNILFQSDGSGTVSNVNSGWGGVQVLLVSTTASSSSEIEFTLSTHSAYDSFVFEFINLHPSMGSSYTKLIVTAKTSSYGVTTTSTAFAAYNFESGGTPVLGYRTGDDLAQSTSNQPLAYSLAEGPSLPPDNDESSSGEFHLFNPHSTTYVKHWYATTITNSSIGGDICYEGFTAGYYNTTSAITAIKFVMESGNIDAGTIKMYGMK